MGDKCGPERGHMQHEQRGRRDFGVNFVAEMRLAESGLAEYGKCLIRLFFRIGNYMRFQGEFTQNDRGSKFSTRPLQPPTRPLHPRTGGGESG